MNTSLSAGTLHDYERSRWMDQRSYATA